MIVNYSIKLLNVQNVWKYIFLKINLLFIKFINLLNTQFHILVCTHIASLIFWHFFSK